MQQEFLPWVNTPWEHSQAHQVWFVTLKALSINTVKNNHHRIGKMAQQLKAYAALAEDPHSVSAHTQGNSQLSIIPLPGDLRASFGLPRYLPSYIHTPKTNVKLNKRYHITTPELTVVLFGNTSPLQSNSLPSSTSDDYFISLSEWNLSMVSTTYCWLFV